MLRTVKLHAPIDPLVPPVYNSLCASTHAKLICAFFVGHLLRSMYRFFALGSSKFHTLSVMSAVEVTRQRSDSTWQMARGTALLYMLAQRVPEKELYSDTYLLCASITANWWLFGIGQMASSVFVCRCRSSTSMFSVLSLVLWLYAGMGSRASASWKRDAFSTMKRVNCSVNMNIDCEPYACVNKERGAMDVFAMDVCAMDV